MPSEDCQVIKNRRYMRRSSLLDRCDLRGLERKVCMVCVCLVCVLYVLGVFESFDQVLVDFGFRLRGLSPATDHVVVVGIDEKSLVQYGRWPWSRSLHARVISTLAEMHPSVIGFDICFSDPEQGMGDSLLRDALKATGNVILPTYPDTLKVNESHRLEGYDWSKPLKGFFDNAKGLGHIVVIPEYRRVVRRIPLVLYEDHKQIRSLSYGLASSFLGEENLQLLPEIMYLNYSGLQQYSNIISCADILDGEISPEVLRNKAVLVGLTAKGITDFHPTPFIQTSVPGVLLHALATENIITNSYIRRVPVYGVLCLLLGLTLLYMVFWSRYEPLYSTLIAMIALMFLSYMVFRMYNVWLDISVLLVLGVVLVGIRFVFNYLTIASEKRNLKRVFGRYVSEKVLEVILKSETLPKLGGIRQYVTIMFADLRGFTSFAETRQPEEVIVTLNTYLSAISECILKSGGTVDKYTGDGVMGLFGTPLTMENSAETARNTALSIQEVIGQINMRRRSLGIPTLEVGIGIATGEVIVGNIGSSSRMDYTAVGNGVNLAARLEELAGEGQILIDEESRRMLQDEGIVFFGLHKVKGRERAIQVYEVKHMND